MRKEGNINNGGERRKRKWKVRREVMERKEVMKKKGEEKSNAETEKE